MRRDSGFLLLLHSISSSHLVFYGSSLEGGLKCGEGVVLKVNASKTYKVKMGCGKGNNTRGALLALWLLLFYVNLFSLTLRQICRDSKVIIDWVGGMCSLRVIALEVSLQFLSS